jgi:hypothetical protein
MMQSAVTVMWLISVGLKVLLAMVMWRKHLYRHHRLFFVYVAYHVALSLALLVVREWYAAYFYVFWAGEVLDIVLGFGIAYELFSELLAPYEGLQRLGSVVCKWASAVLIVIALIFVAAPASDQNHVMHTILVAERAVAIVQAGLLAFLFLFASSFGITWRHYIFGIATGFGLLAAVNLAAFAARAEWGPRMDNVFNLVQMAAYLSALSVWTLYMWRDEPAFKHSTVPNTHELEKWNEVLVRVLQR